MRETIGDLWDYLGQAPICVTTGALVSPRGECIMLRGCARQARDRFPELPRQLGQLLQQGGNQVYELAHGLVSFPVEDSPFEVPGLGRIERSCAELLTLADARGWSRVVVPRPGCGGGGLQWQKVRPILDKYFDERFWVIHSS